MIQFEKTEDVLLKINELKHQGYDTIHIPGGTSKDGSYYAGAIVAAYDIITKEVYLLGVPYNSRFHLNSENGHNKKFGETPEQTVIRELLEETGLQANREDLTVVWSKEVPDNRLGKSGQSHKKTVYLITKFTGNLFTFEGPNPIDGETAAPLFIPATLFVGEVFKGHLEAVYNAFDALSCESKEYAYALMSLMR